MPVSIISNSGYPIFGANLQEGKIFVSTFLISSDVKFEMLVVCFFFSFSATFMLPFRYILDKNILSYPYRLYISITSLTLQIQNIIKQNTH